MTSIAIALVRLRFPRRPKANLDASGYMGQSEPLARADVFAVCLNESVGRR